MKFLKAVSILVIFSLQVQAQNKLLGKLNSSILFQGNDTVAYRDPAVLYHNGVFYLFFTLVKTESRKIYSYTALAHSRDLKTWSAVKIITPKNQNWDFSSPGNIIRFKKEWVLCLQTYPRPDYTVDQMPRFGSGNARIFLMRSKNLLNWSNPELMKVKGTKVSFADMGRMIDPYLLQDKKQQRKWWCFYKQNGICMSYSYDLTHWNYFGKTPSGENPSVLYANGKYILFYSPKNGIGIKESNDLVHWKDWESMLTLGQSHWLWAKGRITAGTVLDLTANKRFGRYLLFFHGSGPLTEEQGDFDKNASIGLAWSADLVHWKWPGK